MPVYAVRMIACLSFIALLCGACGDDCPHPIDAGPPVDAPVDAPADATVDVFDLGAVQCQTAETCIALTGDGCFQSKPGGVCANCMDQGDQCPPGATCITGGTAGASECAYPCVSDDDCNVGLLCATTGATAGFCSPRTCGMNEPPCPTPYTFCRFGECSRPKCEHGCPPPLTCPLGAGFCLEP